MYPLAPPPRCYNMSEATTPDVNLSIGKLYHMFARHTTHTIEFFAAVIPSIKVVSFDVKKPDILGDNYTYSRHYNLMCSANHLWVLNKNFQYIRKHKICGLIKTLTLSDSEQKLVIIDYDKANLYDFISMNVIRTYEFEFMSGAAFVENEVKLAIATWQRRYVVNAY